MLERVSSRLSGWKGRFLSFAGRITLTKSVLASIPVHTMSSIQLSASVLNDLDKVSINFLWRSTNKRRRQHLIAWNRVCSPKQEGSLGIRGSSEMNKAMLAKLGWRLVQDKTSLRAMVLRSKYRVGDLRDQSWLQVRKHCSSTWKSVRTGLRDVVLQGLKLVVGNGREIRFWTDRWLTDQSLADRGQLPLSDGYGEVLVADLWQDGVGWRLDQIEPYTKHNTRLELAAVVMNNVTGVKDRMAWRGNADGRFTVKSAYSILTSDRSQKQSMEKFFDRIWRVVVPERVRSFLWLVSHQAIMTDVERFISETLGRFNDLSGL